SPDILDPPPESIRPGPLGTARPVTADLAPEADGGHAERRMRLEVAEALVPPNRCEREAVQLLLDEGADRRDRKGAAVEDHDDVVLRSGLSDPGREAVQFLRV